MLLLTGFYFVGHIIKNWYALVKYKAAHIGTSMCVAKEKKKRHWERVELAPSAVKEKKKSI